jgi:hypothetical protein
MSQGAGTQPTLPSNARGPPGLSWSLQEAGSLSGPSPKPRNYCSIQAHQPQLSPDLYAICPAGTKTKLTSPVTLGQRASQWENTDHSWTQQVHLVPYKEK